MSARGNTGGTVASVMVENLLNVVSLMGMYRASENEEYRKAAADWLDRLDRDMASLRRELTKAGDA